MGKSPHKKDAAKPKAAVEKKTAAKAAKKTTKAAKKTVKVDAKHPRHRGSCKVQNCKRTYRAKGYCGVHYKKWKRGEFGKARYRHCQANDCFKPMGQSRFGLCEDHYQKQYIQKIEPPPKPKEEAASEEQGAA